MDTEPHEPVERTGERDLLTEFYGGFNHYVTGRGGRATVTAVLADDVQYTRVTNGTTDAPRRYTGNNAVVDAFAGPARSRADHLQALPERFFESSECVVVEGAYVGTVDGQEFDVPFVHAFELEGGVIRACRAYTDTALERAVFDA